MTESVVARFVEPSPYAGRSLQYQASGAIILEGLGPIPESVIPAVFADPSLQWVSEEWATWATRYAAHYDAKVGAATPSSAQVGGSVSRQQPRRSPALKVVAIIAGIAVVGALGSSLLRMVNQDGDVVMYPDGTIASTSEAAYRDKLSMVLEQLRQAYQVYGSTESLEDALTGAQAFELVYEDMYSITPPPSYGATHTELMTALKKSADGSKRLRSALDQGDMDSARIGGQMVVDGYQEAVDVMTDFGL